MAIPRYVQTNPDEVAAKVVQDEAIIINLATGVYYSMDAVGAAAWSLLETTGDVERTVDALVAAYDVDPAAVSQRPGAARRRDPGRATPPSR